MPLKLFRHSKNSPLSRSPIAPDDFYGPNGIYQNPQSEGSLWERPVSAELISHDDSEPGFKINAGLRVQGGSSRNPDTPKHSMSLRFRSQYGAGKLRYPLYRDAPSGRKAAENFDTPPTTFKLQLRLLPPSLLAV